MARVIAFEGVDGAGKSTVLELVAERLRERGLEVGLPRIGKDHASKPIREIRQLTRDRTNFDLTPRAELLLYCARESQVLEQLVRPMLADGATVLLDRSMLTPIVLASYGRGLDLASCEAVAAESSAGLRPDLTLIFDVDPRTSRIRKRLEKIRTGELRNSGRKSMAGSSLGERVRAGYLALAERDGLPVFHCERATPSEIADRVLAKLETDLLHARGSRPYSAFGLRAGSLRVPRADLLVEAPEDARPWWRVDPGASFEQAIESVPALVGLYFTRELALGRALRWELFEREPALAIWAADLSAWGGRTDPVLVRGLERAPELVLARVADTAAAAELRERLISTHPIAVARSLVGVSGEAADRMRNQLSTQAPGAVLESLAGRSDAFALALRERLWKHGETHERAIALRGCDDVDAWERRERLLLKDPAVALPTLCGLPIARVDPILHRYATLAPKQVLAALHGRADASAHRLREQLIDTGREVIDSLAGLDDPASWSLRERCCERWPSTVVGSLLGIESDRAEALIARCRAHAPDDLFLARRLFERSSQG
jgi:dTMP kinase